MARYRWTIDPAGHGMTAGSFFMRPADMAKIGQLVLNGGVWNGKRIISKKWLDKSTKCDIPIQDASFMKTSQSNAGIPQPTYYGFYWYREVIKTSSGSYPVILASGNGGQYIMILESLDMVVVFTQGNYRSWKAKQAFDMMARYIVQAGK
ncbi:hypothetical protein [Hufsiella ginkgonis]|uniref:Serine hydrolase n=1 Tax=Hufsiella ginkgonis TaxID=2695274 RepID=A0A7K1XSF8_9SPHI|nr:hypothetical protein [Hufsiella ginkgonis]MXV13882.1 hypothetical protein [Hufsiella ginkgonis]